MSRRHVTFGCEGETLVGTVDDAGGEVGLLLVSGGNEPRAGAWSGQAMLAAWIAEAGFPVFRFDRRGVGDSTGANSGFRYSTPDIAAAITAFRAECPHLARIAGLGNCDAASAMMLAGGAGLDGLILSNPWTIESDDAASPPAALRMHYRQRLADPAALLRLLRGKVSLAKLAGSLRDAVRPAPAPTNLARKMARGVEGLDVPLLFLLAERDRTGQAFAAAWRKEDPRLRTCPGATHSYVEPQAREWLYGQVIRFLNDLS